jgi:hypothetical protein
MPMRGELPPISTRSIARAAKAQPESSFLTAALSNQELQGIAIFCAIGLLLELNVLLRCSDLGANLVGLMLQ